MSLRFPNPFSRKKRKKKSLRWTVAKALILPCIIMFAVLVTYWASDQFWVYTQMLLWQQDKPDPEVDPDVSLVPGGGGTIQGGSTSTPGASGNLSGAGGGLGGVNLALMNNIAGSYCGDWLLIARDHANKTYMQDEVAWPKDKEAPIVLLMGTAMKESDLQTIKIKGQNVLVPHSNINIQDYEYGKLLDSVKYDLYTINSEWLSGHTNAIDPKYNTSMKDGGYYTTFQISDGYLAKSPASDTTGSGGSYPSLMNGYSIAEGTVREKSVGDYGYFPDQISATIQSAWSRLQENRKGVGLEYINLDTPFAAGIGYAIHNAGQGHFPGSYGFAWWGSGITNSLTWGEKVTAYYPNLGGTEGRDLAGQLTAETINAYTAAAERVYAYINSNDEMSEGDYTNRAVFDGMCAAVGLYGCDGFVTSASKSNMESDIKNSGYCHGFGIAYRALTGNSTSDSEMPSIVSGLDTSKGDELNGSGYYKLAKGKYDSDPTVYTESAMSFVAPDGSSHKFVHMYAEEPTSGLLWVPIGGAYLYWKMLQYAGVDCTFEEARNDSTSGGTGGNLIEEIPVYVTGSTEVGERIARRAIMMSWPDQNDAKATWGNALYLCVYHIVRTQHEYVRSCDSFASTAILWGGGDDNIPEQSASSQYRHCAKTDIWTEIPYSVSSPDLSTLMPGDIIFSQGTGSTGGVVNKGHIMVYVGKELMHEYYPDTPDNFDLCHASLGSGGSQSVSAGSRSSKCASLAGYTSWFHGEYSGRSMYAMRTSGMSSSKWVNILTDAEVNYLFNNPWLLGTEVHKWHSGESAPIVDIPDVS